jgi:hypothetical protein
MPDSDAIMQSMRENSLKRMKNAEEAQRRSMAAYQSGRFAQYWATLGKEAEDRVEAEYVESNTDGGDTGEAGGGGAGDAVSTDDRDGPPESSETEPPATTGT